MEERKTGPFGSAPSNDFEFEGDHWSWTCDGETTRVYDQDGDERIALPGRWTQEAILATLHYGEALWKRGREYGEWLAFHKLRQLIGVADAEGDEK